MVTTAIGNQLLNEFKNSASFVDFLRDPIRNQVERSEIAASLLYYLAEQRKIEAKEVLDAIQNWNGDLSCEYGYKPDDDAYGYKGAVTVGFWLIALSSYYKNISADDWVMGKILELCNYIFASESDGYVRKGEINRYNVLNTNMLVGYGFKCVGDIFIAGSHRNLTYHALARRTVAKTLIYQRFDGAFPYQTDNPRVNLIYHYMVVSLLKISNLERNDLLINRAIRNAIALSRRTILPTGQIDWRRQEIDDKTGAIWSYGWLYGALSDKTERVGVLEYLNRRRHSGALFMNDTDEIGDKFYSAWLLLGMIIGDKNNKELIDQNKGGWPRLFLLDLLRICERTRVGIKYVQSRIYKVIFRCIILPREWPK